MRTLTINQIYQVNGLTVEAQLKPGLEGKLTLWVQAEIGESFVYHRLSAKPSLEGWRLVYPSHPQAEMIQSWLSKNGPTICDGIVLKRRHF